MSSNLPPNQSIDPDAMALLVEYAREQRHAHLIALAGTERFLKEAGVIQHTTAEIRQQWRQMRDNRPEA